MASVYAASAGSISSGFSAKWTSPQSRSTQGLDSTFAPPTRKRQGVAGRLAGVAAPSKFQIGSTEFAGGTRHVHVTTYAGAVLHVGGERVRFGELLARSLRASPSLGSIDGVLGTDALTSGRVVIDFQAGEFSISDTRYPPGPCL